MVVFNFVGSTGFVGVVPKMNENLSTDDTDSHRFFFSLRSLRLCGLLFS